ncbi:MAG: hypothetical protein P9F19_11075 [Candidatus Contendobacter sp.]|nr:hypothetical protein [Candidatus Contendobacter sp.]
MILKASLGPADIKAWPVGPVKLSQALYAHHRAISAATAATVNAHLQGLHSARDLAKTLYEGYDFKPDTLQVVAKLPKYLRVKFNAARAAKLKTPALRAAYLQAIQAAEAGAGQAQLEQVLKVAFYERNRYLANRIARTEIARAQNAQIARELLADEQIGFVQIRLSSKHPKTDICDLHAKLDAYGLGPGVYPKAEAPLPPFHPHCYCLQRPILSIPPGQKVQAQPNAARAFLKSIPPDEARQVMGGKERLRRVLEDGDSIEAVVNTNVDPLYHAKRMGDILTTTQPLPVQQAMTLDDRELRRKLDRFYAQCTEKKPEFDALVTRLAQQTGSEPLLVPLKSNERALEKVITSLGGKLDGLTDVLRATLVFEAIADVVAAHDALLKQVSVLRERNLYREGVSLSDGYRDTKIDIDFDGIPVELQLNTRKILEAKEKAHQLYEEKRQLLAGKRSAGSLSPDQKRQLRELDRQMRKIYQEAE